MYNLIGAGLIVIGGGIGLGQIGGKAMEELLVNLRLLVKSKRR